ncbi:MAG: hypothetical protein KGQ58_00395 [Proteobacteria bacterium]|nr:hypothetical protein [Pseudomonadota bacterium]MDE3207671.1 hypothetical protein [Pseudomonadota bacterium]
MSRKYNQSGFGLALAVFILIILAALGAYLALVIPIEANENSEAIQAERAYQAARAGMEWGLYQALRRNLCTASQSIHLDQEMSGFSVVLTCQETQAQENGQTLSFATLTATASYGISGQQDYVQREVKATVIL